jgi:hypothetical protein
MKREVIAVAIALGCVACGGSDEKQAPAAPRKDAFGATQRGENQPPVIESAVVTPQTPGVSNTLKLEVVARDPDQDRLRTSYTWYRNGELMPDETNESVSAGTFNRGDRVYAVATVTDGKEEVTRQSTAVAIGNAAPTVLSVRISPTPANTLSLLQADANAQDPDGDPTELSYRWLKNGELIPNASNARLEPGVAHRGDRVAVQVSVTDGSDTSEWVSSPQVVLENSSPAITTQPNYELSGNGQYSYEIGAKDPDGDSPLKYEVVSGPPGMTVDVTGGRVTWKVPADAKGTYPIELAVSDPYGGRTSQNYSLAVDWNEPPAAASKSTGEAAAPKPAAKPAAKRRAPEAGESPESNAAAESGEYVPPKTTTKAKPAKPAKATGDEEEENESDQGEGAEEEE